MIIDKSTHEVIKVEKGKVEGIDYQRVFAFLQGAVYCWCKNKEEWFSLRDLMGGVNNYWIKTPLFSIYDKHYDKKKSNEEAAHAAAKLDAGWMLKNVIIEDKRYFYTKKESTEKKPIQYKWDGTENDDNGKRQRIKYGEYKWNGK